MPKDSFDLTGTLRPDWDSILNPFPIEQITRLKDLAIRNHYACGDPWYSCPKSDDGCADESRGDDCTCGADKHNVEVLSIFAQIEAARIKP